MVFSFPFLFHDPCCSSYSVMDHLFQTMSQPVNLMSVKYLPIYRPSDEEKADPAVFAENVKAMMVANSHLTHVDYTYSDKILYEKAVGYENSEVRKRRKKEERENGKKGCCGRSSSSSSEVRQRRKKEERKDKKKGGCCSCCSCCSRGAVEPSAEEMEEGGADASEGKADHEESDQEGHSVGHLSRTVGLLVTP